ncbi:peptidase M16 domain-containing protein [Rhodopirellula baltica SH28]|uniref:Peptidase M16 domain-containing protein n=1 Tax=Rhodopirellula baltica SH28 TaxID=993517 RepID=K5CDK6_RHOBT|nr:peptidase M16 domain-containing protein [Rhodopirellula baltica SH28]
MRLDIERVVSFNCTRLMLFLAFSLTVWSKLLGEMPEPVNVVEGISEYHLDNGLKVLTVPDPSIPTLTINVIVRAGSRNEPYGQKGIAHLLEHMMFKGTATFPDVRNIIRRNGWSMQASTWNDFTNYEATMPGTPENLEKIIHFEADRFANLRLTSAQLAEELKIVLNENTNAKASPENLLTEQMISMALPWHNYGRATIGNQGDLSKITVDSLNSFRQTYYRTDNATVVLAGRFEPELALNTIKKHFGGINRPQAAQPIESTVDPPQSGERRITVRGIVGKPVAALLYHGPAGAHEDFAAFEIFVSALMDTTPGYLWAQERFRSADRVSREIIGDGQLWGRVSGLKQRGFVELYGTMPKDSNPEALLHELIVATEHFADKLTSKEIQSAKRRVLARMQRQLLDLRSFAVELRYWESLGDWRLYFLHRDRIENVRLEDVQRVAKRYLHRDNRTEGLYFASSEPALTEIQESFAPQKDLGGFPRESSIAVGEWIDPDPTTVENRVIRRTFPSGVKVALLPKKTRGSIVHARLTFRIGSNQMQAISADALLLLPDLITSTNAKAATRERIPGSVGLGTTSGNRTVEGLSITIYSEKQYFLRMLDRLNELLSEPLFTQKEFEALKRTNVDSLERRLGLPYPLADAQLRRSNTQSLKEELKSLKSTTFADVLSCYRSLTGKVHGEFVAVGDFDTETVVAKVKPTLARWQSELKLQSPIGDRFASTSTELQIDGSPSACFAGELYVPIGSEHPDYVALLVAHRVWMLYRLIPRISQDVGLSYYYSNSFQPVPGMTQVQVSLRATCDSARLPELKQAITDSFSSLQTTEITADELSIAKEQLANAARMKFLSDKSLLSSLAETTSEDRTFLDEFNLAERIKHVGLAEVHQAAQRHLIFDRMIIAVAGDLASSNAHDQ